MLNCNMMTRSLCCVSTEVRDLPTYDGLGEVNSFLDRLKREMPERQCFQALNCVLRAMAMWWWGIHRRSFEDWCTCRKMLHPQFEKPIIRMEDKCNEHDGLCAHMSRCI